MPTEHFLKPEYENLELTDENRHLVFKTTQSDLDPIAIDKFAKDVLGLTKPVRLITFSDIALAGQIEYIAGVIMGSLGGLYATHESASTDTHSIFINPLSTSETASDSLIHEMIHAQQAELWGHNRGSVDDRENPIIRKAIHGLPDDDGGGLTCPDPECDCKRYVNEPREIHARYWEKYYSDIGVKLTR